MKMTVGCVQHSFVLDKQANHKKTSSFIAELAKNGAHLIVLPELHSTRYFCQQEDIINFNLAETIPGPATDYFANLAKKLSIVIVGSFFEKRTTGLYHNTAVVFDSDGSIAGTYRKMHIPDDPGYYEKYYFTPGDLGFNPIQTSIGKLGVLVCWDQWFPEAARIMRLKGAELLIYPTAIGWDDNDSSDEQQIQLNNWQTIQRSHAIANGLPVISCNRVGLETIGSSAVGQNFWGHSFICDARGYVLTHASAVDEKTIIAEIDSAVADKQRIIWPFLRDRRVDYYSDINKLFIDKDN